jgi:hypothetical protein
MRKREEIALLLNDVSQRHQNPITEGYDRDMRPIQVLTKRSHHIPCLHNIGFSPIDVRDVARFTANVSG